MNYRLFEVVTFCLALSNVLVWRKVLHLEAGQQSGEGENRGQQLPTTALYNNDSRSSSRKGSNNNNPT